jgi:mRNA interferase MazF
MKRGDIWTVAGDTGYAGKPRPVVIVQDDSFDATDSITICAFTTDQTEAPLFRLPVAPNERNGLRAACRLMVDKITTVPKTKVGAHIGRLDDEDILRLNRAVLVFLGLAGWPREQAVAVTECLRNAGRMPQARNSTYAPSSAVCVCAVSSAGKRSGSPRAMPHSVATPSTRAWRRAAARRAALPAMSSR